MSDTGPCETPMFDHVVRFWELLADEHVRILIDIRRDHDEGQPPHWDSASFSNDVAKAIVADKIQGREANIVWLRNVGDEDNDCWVVCAKGDPGAVSFTPGAGE